MEEVRAAAGDTERKKDGKKERREERKAAEDDEDPDKEGGSGEEAKKPQPRETDGKRQSGEKAEDLILLSNKVRIKGPATVAPPPFPIPALISTAVLRNEKKSLTVEEIVL